MLDPSQFRGEGWRALARDWQVCIRFWSLGLRGQGFLSDFSPQKRDVGLLQDLHILGSEVQAFRSPRGDAACKCVSFVTAYPGCHPHCVPRPHLSPLISILHPWHHPIHAGVLSVRGGGRVSNFYPFAFSCLHPTPTPMDNPHLRGFSTSRVLCNPLHLLKRRFWGPLERDLIQHI